MILGVTGPSGSGKGTVSKMLENRGFYHIDTDRLARLVVPETLHELVREFGEILDENGNLDRRALAKKAFSSAENTEALNKIMHGAIMRKVDSIIVSKKEEGISDFVIDGAALYEAGADKICDYVIAVLCDLETRLNRVIVRDRITEKQARERFSRQLSDCFLREHADFVIINNDLSETEKEIEKILYKISGGIK